MLKQSKYSREDINWKIHAQLKKSNQIKFSDPFLLKFRSKQPTEYTDGIKTQNPLMTTINSVKSNILFKHFIYLRHGKTKRDSNHWCIPQMNTMAGTELSQSQESGNEYWFYKWMAGIQLNEPSSRPSRHCISRKLEAEARMRKIALPRGCSHGQTTYLLSEIFF